MAQAVAPPEPATTTMIPTLIQRRAWRPSLTLGIGGRPPNPAAAAEAGDAAARAGLADPDAPGGDRADAVRRPDRGDALADLQRRRARGDRLEVLAGGGGEHRDAGIRGRGRAGRPAPGLDHEAAGGHRGDLAVGPAEGPVAKGAPAAGGPRPRAEARPGRRAGPPAAAEPAEPAAAEPARAGAA